MVHNAADEKQVNESEKDLKNQRDQELEDIKFILKTPAGTRFFRRLMAQGSVFHTTFTGNSHSYFKEGHRNLALIFFNDICEAAPNKVAEIMIKKQEKQK